MTDMDDEVISQKIQEAVEKVLARDKEARGNDHWLIYLTLKELGFKVFLPWKDFDRMPSFETITRCRRKIQHDEGRFLPVGPIVQVRLEREELFRQSLSGNRHAERQSVDSFSMASPRHAQSGYFKVDTVPMEKM